MDITIKKLKQLIQSSHVNFLYGSGLSCNYLSTLGNIEKLLTEVSESTIEEELKTIISISLYATYVKTVMEPCLPEKIKTKQLEYEETFKEYVRFLKALNSIMARRSVNLINKQINLFTTNIDDFMEKAAEETKIELNDGFKGHIMPIFSEDSFSTIKFKSSPLYQNTSAVPVFNLLKIHGSINWKSKNGDEIIYDTELSSILQISKLLKDFKSNHLIEIKKDSSVATLKTEAETIRSTHGINKYNEFNQLFSQLVVINPTKEKFKTTVIDYHFYELMRLYSNALELSSSLLFVAGFSFADEHIANITMRAANANPTLQIIVFAYDETSKKEIRKILYNRICNNNISILSPQDYIKAIQEESPEDNSIQELKCFDFKSINDFVFTKLESSL